MNRYKNRIKIKLFSLRRKGFLPISIFFLIFPRFMKPEIDTTLSGIIKFYKRENITNYYKIRRNIHRLEKGICAKDRKEVFALAFIEETVNELIRLIEKNKLSKNDLNYFGGVLFKYFNVVNKENQVIKKCYHSFQKIVHDGKMKRAFEVYTPKKVYNYNVNFEDELNSFLLNRVSIRYYSNKIIEKGNIDRALKASFSSPSACNRYSFKYLVFTEKSKVENILKYALGHQGDKKKVPGVALLIGDLSAYNTEGERHLIYIDGSLSAMNFTLSLQSQNIGSCIHNYAENITLDKQLKEELNLEEYEKALMFITFGYPNTDLFAPLSQKRELNEVSVIN